MLKKLQMLLLVPVLVLFMWYLSFPREGHEDREERLIQIMIREFDVFSTPVYANEEPHREYEYFYPQRNMFQITDTLTTSALPITEFLEKEKRIEFEKLIDHIKHFEGFYPNAYYDLDGSVAIGYGFTRSDIPGLKISDTITKEEADELLLEVIMNYGEIVDRIVKVPLSENQRNSLISFAYNIGPNAFKGSFVVREINNGNIRGAPEYFRYWCYVKGRKIAGLIKRRSAEKEMFLGESEDS